VVGNRAGTVGIGYGKANEVPSAVDKAIKDAKKNLVHLSLTGRSIPHRVWGRYGASKLILVPAKDGTGVIAGSAARAVLELAGIHDVLTKSYGSPTPKNLVKATLCGLMALRSQAHIEELRGVKVG
jgi:small subunit ribosomal protein S5